MHTTHLRKVGGSVMLAIPPALLEVLQLQAGAPVGLTLEDGRLVIGPVPKPRYALTDLLAQCDPAAERTPEDEAWLSGAPAGSELF